MPHFYLPPPACPAPLSLPAPSPSALRIPGIATLCLDMTNPADRPQGRDNPEVSRARRGEAAGSDSRGVSDEDATSHHQLRRAARRGVCRPGVVDRDVPQAA
eukprot:760184-Hanusia_phi.AAC.4